MSPDGKVTTLSLRRGMKWSDGQPFTADDFVFWYQDVLQQQGPDPHAADRDDHQRQAHRHREGRRGHHPVRLAGAVLRAAHRARLGVGHRAPCALRDAPPSAASRRRTTSSSSTRSTPPRKISTKKVGRAELRRLGHHVQESQRRLPQRGPARGDAVEDDVALSPRRPGCSSGIPTACGSTPTATSSPISTGSG